MRRDWLKFGAALILLAITPGAFLIFGLGLLAGVAKAEWQARRRKR